MTKRSLRDWENFVDGHVAMRVDVLERQKIAKHCFERDQKDSFTCLWHEIALMYGTLDRCQCVPCLSSRKQAA